MIKKEGTSKKLSISIKSSERFKKYVYGDSIDELIDGLALLKDGTFINKFLYEFPDLSKEQLERLDSIILTSKDANQIYEYAKRRKEVSNIEDFEDTLITLKNPFRIVEFTRFVKAVNVEKMQDAVIEIGDTATIVSFSLAVKDSDNQKTKKALFEKKVAYDIYNFISNKEDELDLADIFKAEDIIIASKDTETMNFWARRIKHANIDKIQDAIIKSKDTNAMLDFAEDVEGADIRKIRKAIKETKDKKAIRDLRIITLRKRLFKN